MKNKATTEETIKEQTALASSVLRRLEGEHVVPCSKWRFKCIELSVWILWALTVVFGAVSVAVMFFVAGHARFALHEATHDTPLSFFVEVLPYLWIVVFGIMAVLAYINFRHTKRGYRYQIHHIVVSSLVFSVAGGVLLHFFGVGALIDTQFGKRMDTYPSMEKMEERLWQAAAQGRLVGTFMGMDETDTLYLFTDKEGVQWQIETLELRDRDKQLLSSGHQVRVLGTTTDPAAYRFYACGVFPWMFDKDVTTNEMREDRKQFVSRMYEHMESSGRVRNLEKETYGKAVEKPFTKGKCGELAAMKRMRF